MKPPILAILALLFAGAGPASALTLSLSITGLVDGSPSPLFAGAGPGSTVLLSFDLPDTDGTIGFYPLSATFIGLPPVVTDRGFGFGPPGADTTPVQLGASYGNIGDPTVVQLNQVSLTGATPVDLNQYTYSVPGVGSFPLLLGPAIEAAALAGDLTQGTLTLVDQVGPGTENRWTYSFAVVPEPSAAALVLAAVALASRRRRPVRSEPAAPALPIAGVVSTK